MTHMHLRYSALFVALGLSLLAPTGASANEPAESCDGERFFIHVPTWAPAGDVRDDIGDRLMQAIAPEVRREFDRMTQVKPVFDSRRPQGGHKRFWTVRIPGLSTIDVCDALILLRREAEAVFPAETPLYIGRHCPAVALGSPHGPDWQREVMGVPEGGLGEPAAQIVLVDGGFSETPAWAPRRLSHGQQHPHGEAMHGAMRQISAPDVLDYRVLDEHGLGSLDDVARAIDHVTRARPNSLVVNLSLGWAPELERRRRFVPRTHAEHVAEGEPEPFCFDADGDEVHEDPIGEAVRYAMQQAALRDAAGDRPSLAVVVAAGNRPRLFGRDENTPYEGWYHVADGEHGEHYPDSSDATEADLFYPAQWAERDGLANVLPVGASDVRDRRSLFSPPSMAPLLLAPGTHVQIDEGTWTGSSVAAAYAAVATASALTEDLNGAGAITAVLDGAAELPSGHLRLSFDKAPEAVEAPAASRRRFVSLATRRWLQQMRRALPDAPDTLGRPDQYSIGLAGPQPPVGGCPECLMVMRNHREGRRQGTLRGRLKEGDIDVVDRAEILVKWKGADGELQKSLAVDVGELEGDFTIQRDLPVSASETVTEVALVLGVEKDGTRVDTGETHVSAVAVVQE